MYTSLTFGELLNGFKNETAYDFLNILGLLPFVLALYTGSELHRTVVSSALVEFIQINGEQKFSFSGSSSAFNYEAEVF